MGKNLKRRAKGCGCLLLLLAAGFLVLGGRWGNAFPIDQRVVIWVVVVVPWGIWYWWSYLRGASVPDEGVEAAELRPGAVRRAFWFRFIVWTITAILMSAGVIAVQLSKTRRDLQLAADPDRSPVERVRILCEYMEANEAAFRAQASPPDIRKLKIAHDDLSGRIAAEHHMSVAELQAFLKAHMRSYLPPTFYELHRFEISTLQFDGLLILNIPVYWLLALVFFRGWRDYSELLDTIMAAAKDDLWDYPRAVTFLAVCGAIVTGELYLLRGYLA